MARGNNDDMTCQSPVTRCLMRALVNVALALGSWLTVTISLMSSGSAYQAPIADGVTSESYVKSRDPMTAQIEALASVNSGTAFFISHDGKVLTSAHVVRDCRDITIWINNEEPRTGTVIGVDVALDIAILASSGKVIDIANINTAKVAPEGEPVTTIGFGTRQHEPRWPEITTGTVSGRATLPSGAHALLVNASLKPGNSGGPIVDRSGSVIGLVIGRYTARPQLAVAVPALDLRKFLGRFGIATAAATAGSDVQQEDDLNSRLMHISALIQCTPRKKGLSE